MSWEDDPIIKQGGSGEAWHNDPVVETPTIPEALGHSFVNNLPLGGQAAAVTKSLGNDKGYSQNLEDWNKQTDLDKSAHPVAYGTGATAGAVGTGLASTFIPGVAEAPILSSAVLGAANAAGNTDVVKHPVKAGLEAVGGAGLGAGTASIMGKVAPFLAEKFGAAATDPETAALAMKNPGALKNIPSTEDLSQKLPDIVKKINSQIGEHMDIAKDALSTSRYLEDGAITKDEIFKTIATARKELGGIYTSEGKKAAAALEELGDDLTKTHETVSQNQIYSIMQKIDDEIPWDKIHGRPDEVTAEEQAMVNVRRGLRNLLGEKNPDFGSMMEPVSILEKDKGDLIRQFGIKRDVEGMRPGDQTVSKLANALVETEKKAKPESSRILENIGSSTGEDLTTPLKLQAFKNPTPSNPMGVPSRIGAGAVGGAVGHSLGLPGMGIGAVMGQRVLRQPMSTIGRNAASEVIQNLPGLQRGASQAMIDYLESKFGGKKGNAIGNGE